MDENIIETISNQNIETNSEIGCVRTAYAEEDNVANYYEWDNARYDTYGYFVSLVPNTSKIKICDGTDIFGVSVSRTPVDAAGFIGGQSPTIPRDNSYGLIVNSGLVDVRCELDVKVGDYVISNAYGYAKKSSFNYGYKVVALENKDGIKYAVIMLGVQADVTNAIGVELYNMDVRMDAAESNIISAVNVANQAYNKANEIEVSNNIMSGQVDVAIDKVDKMESDVNNLTSQVSTSAFMAVQAKAIAESAAISAESMRNEAVEKANEALDDSAELRREFEAKVAEIENELGNMDFDSGITLEQLEETKKILQDNINTVSSELNNAKINLNNTRNELLSEIDDIMSSLDDTDDAVASITNRVEENETSIDNLTVWKNNTNVTITNIQQTTNENSGEISILTAWRSDVNDDIESIASIKTQSDANKSRIDSIASWQSETEKSVTQVKQQADDNAASIEEITNFEGEFGQAITGFVQEATKENATVKAIAGYQQKDEDGNPYGPSGVSALIGQVDANTASINLLSSLEGEGFTGLAGLIAQVQDNQSSVATLASHVVGEFENTDDWVEDGKDTNKIYYVKNRRLYYYYADQQWHSTDKAYKAGLVGSLAGVQNVADANKAQLDAMVHYDKDGKSALAGLTAYVDENSAHLSELAKYHNEDSGNSGAAGLVADVNENTSTLTAVVNHKFTKNDGTTVTGLAGLNAYVNANESAVALVSNRIAGKYVILEEAWDTQNKDTSMVYYVKAATQEDKDLWYYYDDGWKSSEDPYDAGLPRAMSGIQAQTDDNSANINSLVSWRGDMNTAMARIEQKADADGAYIQSTVSNIAKYSVGPYSQAYGFTLEQATNVLEEGMIYVPTINKVGKDAEVYKYIDADGKSQESPREFLQGYLYRWGKTPDNLYGWITVDKNYSEDKLNTSAPAVYFHSAPPSVSGNFGYWYTNADKIADGYESYTLYKWSTYITQDEAGQDTTKGCWVPVATLADNSSSRAVSQIRQDTNSIELRVTNTEGSVTSSKQWIDNHSANIQDVISWKNDNGENLVAFMQTADDNFASAAQVAQIVDKDGKINAASIVTAVNAAGANVVITADHINLDGRVTIGDLSKEAQQNLISSSVIYYGLSDSETTEPTTWVEAKYWNQGDNVWTPGKYIWQKTEITKVSGDDPVVTAVCIQGAKGEAGQKGANGNTPQVGENGNWWIGETDTGIKAVGKDGEDGTNGTNGKDGKDGEDGLTPYIKNGNWWIGETDTGIKAEGVDGQNGQNGNDGVSVTKVVTRYYISTTTDIPSNDANDNNGWFENFDTMLNRYWALKSDNAEATYYIWSQEKVYYSVGNPSHSDATVNGASSVIALYCQDNGVTKIDGAHIATGTIDTVQLAAEAITAEKIAANAITSRNYQANVQGSKLNLADGSFDSKYFKVSSEGEMTATSGYIGGWTIDEGGLNHKHLVGLSSDNSLMITKSTSPVRFYAGSGGNSNDVSMGSTVSETINFTVDDNGEYTHPQWVADNYNFVDATASGDGSEYGEFAGEGTKTLTYHFARTIQPIVELNGGILNMSDVDGVATEFEILVNGITKTTVETQNASMVSPDYEITIQYGREYGQKTFVVLEDGSLFAGNANLQGGTIGGWQITNGGIVSKDFSSGMFTSNVKIPQSESPLRFFAGRNIIQEEQTITVNISGKITLNDKCVLLSASSDDADLKFSGFGTNILYYYDASSQEERLATITYSYYNKMPFAVCENGDIYGSQAYLSNTSVDNMSIGYNEESYNYWLMKPSAIEWHWGNEDTDDMAPHYIRIGKFGEVDAGIRTYLDTSGKWRYWSIGAYEKGNAINGVGIDFSIEPDETDSHASLFGTWKADTCLTTKSDESVKNSLELLDERYSVLFDNLNPLRFKYNDGTSGRYHTGYTVQGTQKALSEAGLSSSEFAALCLATNEKDVSGLRYEEFVALNTWQIQKLKTRVAELENKIALLTEQGEKGE